MLAQAVMPVVFAETMSVDEGVNRLSFDMFSSSESATVDEVSGTERVEMR